jgi:hypothetical protein
MYFVAAAAMSSSPLHQPLSLAACASFHNLLAAQVSELDEDKSKTVASVAQA